MLYGYQRMGRALALITIGIGIAFGANGSAKTVTAANTEWLRAGTTTPQCSYFAALEFLKEFPVARLLIKPSFASFGNLAPSGSTASVIPLAKLDYSFPESYHQIPQPEEPPSYQVQRCDSCGARETWRIIRYLSGSFEECLVIKTSEKR